MLYSIITNIRHLEHVIVQSLHFIKSEIVQLSKLSDKMAKKKRHALLQKSVELS